MAKTQNHKIRVEHLDGTEDYLDTVARIEKHEEYGKQSSLRVITDRDEVKTKGLKTRDDEIYFEGGFKTDFTDRRRDIWENYGSNCEWDQSNLRWQLTTGGTTGTTDEIGILEYTMPEASKWFDMEFDFTFENPNDISGGSISYAFHADRKNVVDGAFYQRPKNGITIILFSRGDSLSIREWNSNKQVNEWNTITSQAIHSGDTNTLRIQFDDTGNLTVSLNGTNELSIAASDLNDTYYGAINYITGSSGGGGQGEPNDVYIDNVDFKYDEFGGVLGDVERSESGAAELIVDSFERRAENAEPAPGGTRLTNYTDQAAIRYALGFVDDLSEGFIDETSTGRTFVYSHMSPAKMIRVVSDGSSGLPFYRPNKRIDYYIEPENFKNEPVKPSLGVIDGKFKVERDDSQQEITHVRLIGAGEGKHQIATERVAPSYSDGDPKNWVTYSNKDIPTQELLERMADTFIAELADEYVQVKTRLRERWVSLGSQWRVVYPEKEVDHQLTAVDTKKIVDGNGVRWKATLSLRRKSRFLGSKDDKNRADIGRFNVAVEGYAVPINASGGRQPVDSNNVYRMQFYYPDEVISELRLNVQIMGLAYRAYSSGAINSTAAAYGDVSEFQVEDNRMWKWGLTNPSSDPFMRLRVPDTPNGEFNGCDTMWFLHNDTGGSLAFDWEIRNITEGQLLRSEITSVNNGDPAGANSRFDTTEVSSGDTLEFSINGADFKSANLSKTQTSLKWIIRSRGSKRFKAPHAHAPDPGLVNFEQYPSSCTVKVNGNTVGRVSGNDSQSWDSSVDIRGKLLQGRVNEITISSETTGHIQAFIEGDVYRQILGDG